MIELNYDRDWKVIVRVYLDLQGLVEAHDGHHRLHLADKVRLFVSGFNQVTSSFDIIDSGIGDKEALHKIKGESQHSVNIVAIFS